MALKLGEAYLLIGVNRKALDRQLGAAKARFEATIAGMQAVARKAKMGLMLGAAGMAYAIKTAAAFEQGMARVKALTNASTDEFDRLNATARLLGSTTRYTAREAADAMGYFGLAGFKADKIIQAMPATLDMAAAGQLDVAAAADIVAKLMAGMGLSASETTHAVDVLTKAFTTSNTDLLQLGEAFKYVGPMGRTAGKSIEELTATIQVMSNAGIQGQMAGTALRNMLIRLQRQPSEVRKALELLGVSISDQNGKMKHMADIVDEVKAALQKFTPVEQQAITAALAGTRAMAAFSALLAEGGDAIRKYETSLQNADGTAKQIAKTMLDTLEGKVLLLKSAFEGFAIALGEKVIPPLAKVVKHWTSLLQAGAEGDAFIERLIRFVEIGAKLSIIAILMPKIAQGLYAIFAAATALGGGLVGLKAAVLGLTTSLGITGLAFVLGLVAQSFVEAKLRGEAFGDVLYRNIKLLAGYEDAMDEIDKRRQKLGERLEVEKGGELRFREAEAAAEGKELEFVGSPEYMREWAGIAKKRRAAADAAKARYDSLLADWKKAKRLQEEGEIFGTEWKELRRKYNLGGGTSIPQYLAWRMRMVAEPEVRRTELLAREAEAKVTAGHTARNRLFWTKVQRGREKAIERAEADRRTRMRAATMAVGGRFLGYGRSLLAGYLGAGRAAAGVALTTGGQLAAEIGRGIVAGGKKVEATAVRGPTGFVGLADQWKQIQLSLYKKDPTKEVADNTKEALEIFKGRADSIFKGIKGAIENINVGLG